MRDAPHQLAARPDRGLTSRHMARLAVSLVLAACVTVPFAESQPGRLSDACVSRFGAEAASSFPAFDAELRGALANSDPVAMAMLIKYPLRVNEPGGGSYSITGGEYLRRHFQEVFTPEVRNAVDEQSISGLVCKEDQGIRYGHGELSVERTDGGWSIKSVGPDPSSAPLKRTASAVVFVCRTRKHRILIDVDPDNVYRYRSWDSGHSVFGPPDEEVSGGKQASEGSSICAVPVWRFRSGPVVYAVSGKLGCYEESDTPPPGATGDLMVTVKGNIETRAWCY
jgi:hypothetical protein